jgi:hypothetical protein
MREMGWTEEDLYAASPRVVEAARWLVFAEARLPRFGGDVDAYQEDRAAARYALLPPDEPEADR